MSDECKALRNASARLVVTVREMLAPVSTRPSPQRLKLDNALEAVERAKVEWDRAQADAVREAKKED